MPEKQVYFAVKIGLFRVFHQLRVPLSLSFDFRLSSSGSRPPPLDSSYFETPGPGVGTFESIHTLKLQLNSDFWYGGILEKNSPKWPDFCRNLDEFWRKNSTSAESVQNLQGGVFFVADFEYRLHFWQNRLCLEIQAYYRLIIVPAYYCREKTKNQKWPLLVTTCHQGLKR